MIEDKPDMAELLSRNNIRVLLLDAPYNQEAEREKILRGCVVGKRWRKQ
ncbi:MAG: hypothetical protein ACI4FZ_04335 [Lachnospiraceae bacterium]